MARTAKGGKVTIILNGVELGTLNIDFDNVPANSEIAVQNSRLECTGSFTGEFDQEATEPLGLLDQLIWGDSLN